MAKFILDGQEYGGGGSGSNIVKLTQAEYDALSNDKLSNNTIYLITDSGELAAENLFYDGSQTGLGNNVQDAIDELNSNITMILQGNAISENGVETIACPSNSTFTHTVSFSKPFNTIPTIICTCKNNYGGGYSVPVTVNEITKGGFICTIGATGGGGTEVYLTWNATADVAS